MRKIKQTKNSINSKSENEILTGVIIEVSRDKLKVPDWYFKRFKSNVEQAKLSNSIRKFGTGILSVVPQGDMFTIIDGVKRFNIACKMGIETFKCLVYDVSNDVAIILSRNLNNNYAEIDAIEYAKALQTSVNTMSINLIASLSPEDKEAIQYLLKLVDFDWKAYIEEITGKTMF